MHLTTSWDEEESAVLKHDTSLRYRGGVKSKILEDLHEGDRVIILEELEEWVKVRSSQAYIGYIESKFLTERSKATPVPPSDYKKPDYTSVRLDGKVCMGWNVVASNTSFEEVLSDKAPLNVLSPTWFRMKDNEGGIESFASVDYVSKAHDRGLKVWPTLDNFNNSFFAKGGEGRTSLVLESADYRSRLISNVMNEMERCSIDGVNVDMEFVGAQLEDIQENGGEDYIEFIRELSIACRKAGKTLSVDVSVPLGNSFFHRKELGTVCDYVVMMGYDEHYEGSSEAGSVASSEFVSEGIRDTLKEIPADKLINGVPFYSRIWFTAENGEVSSKAGGMAWAKEYIESNSIELAWDEETSQNYGEKTINGNTKVQIWLEDAESVDVKLNIMDTSKLAGAAFWRLGYETDDVWEKVADYIKR
jgi:spore germination protein YaaH